MNRIRPGPEKKANYLAMRASGIQAGEVNV
jgi:hypothetical protein